VIVTIGIKKRCVFSNHPIRLMFNAAKACGQAVANQPKAT